MLVDLSDFLMRDTHGVAGRLGAGVPLRPHAQRDLHAEHARRFRKNTEIEVTTTFDHRRRRRPAAAAPARRQIGGRIGDVTPSAEAVTVRQHHSFIELPDGNYKPRGCDPRSGFGGFELHGLLGAVRRPTSARGSSAAIGSRRRIRTAAMSEPVKPIIYYVDRGTPEPIRTALVEGARWWNQAFEAAGFRNGFRSS